MNLTVGLIVRHIGLDRYLNALGLIDRCGGAGTAKHFLFDCPGYTDLRRIIFECYHRQLRSRVGQIFIAEIKTNSPDESNSFWVKK